MDPDVNRGKICCLSFKTKSVFVPMARYPSPTELQGTDVVRPVGQAARVSDSLILLQCRIKSNWQKGQTAFQDVKMSHTGCILSLSVTGHLVLSANFMSNVGYPLKSWEKQHLKFSIPALNINWQTDRQTVGLIKIYNIYIKYFFFDFMKF